MTKDDDLDSLFADAALHREVLSAGLVARIHADADTWQPKPTPRPVAHVPRGWFWTLSDWFGGTASLAGMTAAGLIGLFLGVAQPVPVASLTELVTGSTTLDDLELLPTGGTLWEQE